MRLIKQVQAEFTINRAYWRVTTPVRLLTSGTSLRKGSVDIFGSLALSLGVPAATLTGLPTLEQLPDETLLDYPVLMQLLAPNLYGELTLSPLAREIMQLNYDKNLTRKEKEEVLRFFLLSHGIKPHFRG